LYGTTIASRRSVSSSNELGGVETMVKGKRFMGWYNEEKVKGKRYPKPDLFLESNLVILYETRFFG